MNYQEIDQDEFHALLMNIPSDMKLLLDGESYICDNVYLRPAINRELMVLPLRYLDGAVKVVKPGKTILYTSDAVHSKPYTIEIVSECL